MGAGRYDPTYGCYPDPELADTLISLRGPGVEMEPLMHQPRHQSYPYKMRIILGFDVAYCAWPFRQSNLDGEYAGWITPERRYIRICWN